MGGKTTRKSLPIKCHGSCSTRAASEKLLQLDFRWPRGVDKIVRDQRCDNELCSLLVSEKNFLMPYNDMDLREYLVLKRPSSSVSFSLKLLTDEWSDGSLRLTLSRLTLSMEDLRRELNRRCLILALPLTTTSAEVSAGVVTGREVVLSLELEFIVCGRLRLVESCLCFCNYQRYQKRLIVFCDG